MVSSPPSSSDHPVVLKDPAREGKQARKEKDVIQTAEGAIKWIVAPVIWLLVILIAAPPIVWMLHFLGIKRWLEPNEVEMVGKLLLEFKEILLGSTATASIIAYLIRYKK